MPRSTQTLAVRVAADMLGGPRKLRDALHVRSIDVAAWIAGNAEPPREIFLRVVDLMLDRLDAEDRRLVERNQPPLDGEPH